MKLEATIKPQTVTVSVNPATMGVSFGNPIAREIVERDPYTGSYTVTPSSETQILATNNLRMTDNITVNPVPSNYGLITWNGAFLTVS